MADRVSVTLRLGGTLSADRVPDLMAAIAADDAGADWEGEPVTLDRVVAGETLVLVGTEVAWGIFEEIEGFARRAGLVYARWAGGACGSFGPERVVFSGSGEPEHFAASDDDAVMLSASRIRQLGSHGAVLASLERAELAIPPLIVRG
jgi:hypothetical protein